MSRPGAAVLTAMQARALDAVEGLLSADTHQTLLHELMAIPSITGSAAESEAQHWVARRMERAGLSTELWRMDLAALRADPDFPGTETARDELWGCVGLTGVGGSHARAGAAGSRRRRPTRRPGPVAGA